MRQAPSEVFAALGDPTRAAIVALLLDGERSAGDIARHFDMSRPGVGKHVRVLEKAGIVAVRPEGRERMHRLNPQPLIKAAGWFGELSRFWDERLDILKTILENEEGSHGKA